MKSNAKNIIIICILSFSLLGCNKINSNYNDNSIINTEITEDNLEPDIIPKSIINKLENLENSIFKKSKEELLALKSNEIKEIIENQLPNYKEIFKIDDDYIMTEKDWNTIRDIIIIDKYKYLYDPKENSNIEKDNYLDINQLNNLNSKELKKYIYNFYKNLYKNDMNKEELNKFLEDLDIKNMTDDEIFKLRDSLIQNFSN